MEDSVFILFIPLRWGKSHYLYTVLILQDSSSGNYKLPWLSIFSRMLSLLVQYIIYTQYNNASNTGLNVCVCIPFDLIASIGRNAKWMQIFFFFLLGSAELLP